MAILIDPPLWPAHGTVFSHLVSDVSVEELHAFAATVGLSRRAFDRDHYDVPRRRFDSLVAAGALPVPATELARRLIRSGVRIPAHQRPEKLEGVLADAWDRLLPGNTGIAAELMARWSEPHRHYHDRAHLLAVLRALDLLRSKGEPLGSHPRAPWLAAWFHDAVYAGVAGQDEEESARLAEQLLPASGVPNAEIDEVARLVRVTTSHRPAEHDAAGRLLCDADLEVLARPEPAYRRYVAAVRRDYSMVSDVDFARGRSAVLRSLLATEPLFGTSSGRFLWEGPARSNLLAELAELPVA
ncbi:DUF4031 domain-containing protein [Arthrobacter rhombi]|uniref:DUF4031 domain-containing protein n=1 Tax=Arthrobacter rhombi TaxID=71253 RepID=UPI003F9035FE